MSTKEHNCMEHIGTYTRDTLYPFGEVVSEIVFYCTICNKELELTEIDSKLIRTM